MSDDEYEVQNNDVEDTAKEDASVPDQEDDGRSSSTPSVRGVRENERAAEARQSNAMHQRRTRERHRREYRELIERHRAQIEQLAALETRIAAIIRVLEDAGILIPDVVDERMGDPDADDGRRLLAELEAYIDEFNRNS